jgi:hypothetical protein
MKTAQNLQRSKANNVLLLTYSRVVRRGSEVLPWPSTMEFGDSYYRNRFDLVFHVLITAVFKFLKKYLSRLPMYRAYVDRSIRTHTHKGASHPPPPNKTCDL